MLTFEANKNLTSCENRRVCGRGFANEYKHGHLGCRQLEVHEKSIRGVVSPNVASGKSVREGIFGVDDVLSETRNPGSATDGGYDSGIVSHLRFPDEASGKDGS